MSGVAHEVYRQWGVWWCTPVIPALGKLRQEDHEFEASLDYIVRS
jgi:hypothetical protein